ncbi:MULTISPECIES: restriction endonuclease [Enorma]|uniref:restriction endonuclease n=1 Tax=Enorma TaxID=1472762 RepID=UPI00034C0102|nr:MULTISPECIES: restriction endonuclease [Enorma]
MTALKDDKEFRSLDDARWEDLCYLLFKEEYGGLRRVNGSGGDDGIDAYVGDFVNPSIVFQFKFFPNGLGKKQVRQIKSSLETVLEKRPGIDRWILVSSADPTPDAQLALDGLFAEHSGVEIDFFGESEMRHKLIRRPAVRRTFYDDGMETLKGVLSLEGMDPLKRASEGVRIYNEAVVDERLVATVTTDGKTTIIAYSLHPDFADSPLKFTMRLKSKKGVEAYNSLVRRGMPAELSAEDVELDISDLPGVGADEGELQRLEIIPQINPRPSMLRFYASEELGNSQALFVELRTTSEGSAHVVRSNAIQKNAPVRFEINIPLATREDGATGTRIINITPQLIGNKVSVALKGARFLAQLSQTKRLGISNPDEEVTDAIFATLGGIDEDGIWAHQLEYIEAVERVCRFFDIDPAIDDNLNDEEFFLFVMRTAERIRTQGSELDGTTTFSLSELNPNFIRSVNGKEAISLVADMDWSGSMFGTEVNARIRIVASGVPTVENVGGDKWTLAVKGSYRCFIGKSEDDSKTGGAPPIFPHLVRD